MTGVITAGFPFPPHASAQDLIDAFLVLPQGQVGGKGGLRAASAILIEYSFLPTHRGNLPSVDTHTGYVTSGTAMPRYSWTPPGIIEDAHLIADHGETTTKPELLANVRI